MSYVCAVCGKTHEGLPDLGFQFPDYYFSIPEEEREERVEVDADLCRIDNEYCFIRGVILIPVHDHEHDFGIGVWVSQKKENFEIYLENYDSAEIGPFFGWLANHIPFYEAETELLQTRAHFQTGGQRPVIELKPCDHPLYRDYSQGISLDKAWEYVHGYLTDDA